MSLLKFKHNNQTWGIVRNQKCASTSILSYIAQALWDADPKEIQAYNTFRVHAPDVYHKLMYFDQYKTLLEDCDIRIAVWRDPVDKFVSGYYHTMFAPSGAQDALWLGERNIIEFLHNLNHYMTSATVREHCETNTARLGSDKNFYTHVFEYTESSVIADMLGAKSVNHRATDPKPTLTGVQTQLIKGLMREDYNNGWCK